MTSAPVRDPRSDHLRTPENAAFLIIGYQLQRDWARQDTVAGVIEIVLTDRMSQEQ